MTNIFRKQGLWQNYCRQIIFCKLKSKTKQKKNFIYECQKHIRFVSTLAQQAELAWKEFQF